MLGRVGDTETVSEGTPEIQLVTHATGEFASGINDGGDETDKVALGGSV